MDLFHPPFAQPGDRHLNAGGDDDDRSGGENALLGIVEPLEGEEEQQDRKEIEQ
jgi:hypothetical protein